MLSVKYRSIALNANDVIIIKVTAQNMDVKYYKVTIKLNNSNPKAVADDITLKEDDSVKFNPTDNDEDIDKDSLSITSFTKAEYGVVEMKGNTLTYTPSSNYNGKDTFRYTISDGKGGTSTGTIKVTVKPVNDNPVAKPDQSSTQGDKSVLIDVLANDEDIDKDALSISEITTANRGKVQMEGKCIRYTPSERKYTGSDSFEYTIDDGHGGKATAIVTVWSDAVPELSKDATLKTLKLGDQNVLTLPEIEISNPSSELGAIMNVLSSDKLDGIIVATNSEFASVEVSVNNKIIAASKLDTFALNVNDVILVKVIAQNSEVKYYKIVIKLTNSNPKANTDYVTVEEDNSLLIDPIKNDEDIDKDTLTISSFTNTEYGQIVLEKGSLKYTPNANYYGEDSLSYTIGDGKGGAATGTIKITVKPVNDNPVAEPDSITAKSDTPILIDVLSNDTDIEKDTLTIADIKTTAQHGIVQREGNSIRYTPSDKKYSGVDSFEYTVNDGKGGTATAKVTIQIEYVPEPPQLHDDSATVDEDNTVTIDVLSNDTCENGVTLTISDCTDGKNGTTKIVDKKIVYTPKLNYYGEDSFSYTVDYGTSRKESAEVKVTVNPVNDAPIANPDSYTLRANESVCMYAMINNDTDVDTSRAYFIKEIVTEPMHGKVVENDAGTLDYYPDKDYYGDDSFTYLVSDREKKSEPTTISLKIRYIPYEAADDWITVDEDKKETIRVTYNDYKFNDSIEIKSISVSEAENGGKITVNNDNTIDYISKENYYGSDSFTYTVNCGEGKTSTAKVDVIINSINDEPIAYDDIITIDEDTTVQINVLENDTDVEDDKLQIYDAYSPSAYPRGSIDYNAKYVIYTPEENDNTTVEFCYRVIDGNGGMDVGKVTVKINPIQDDPFIKDDLVSMEEDKQLEINVLENDFDPEGDAFSLLRCTEGTNGKTNIVGDKIVYTPNENFYGEDTFDYTIGFGEKNSKEKTAKVRVEVKSVNDAPTADPDSAITNEDTKVIIDVVKNDMDLENETLFPVIQEEPSHGYVDDVYIDGKYMLEYTPYPNYYGSDEFIYLVYDKGAGTSIDKHSNYATVSITINPVIDYTARKDELKAEKNTDTILDVLYNDDNTDNVKVTMSKVSSCTNGGSVSINQDNTVTYTPPADYLGEDSFTYTVSFEDGTTATGTVNVSVILPRPIANPDIATTDEDTPVLISVLDNDLELGTAQEISVRDPMHGTATVEGTCIRYTPDPDYNGKDTIQYYVSNGYQWSKDYAEVSVTINSVFDAPVAVDDNLYLLDNEELKNPGFTANDKLIESTAYAYSYSYNQNELKITKQGQYGDIITISAIKGFSGLSVIEYTITVPSKPELKTTAKMYVYVTPWTRTCHLSSYNNDNDRLNKGVKLEIYQAGNYEFKTVYNDAYYIELSLYDDSDYCIINYQDPQPTFQRYVKPGTYYLYMKSPFPNDDRDYKVDVTYFGE